MECSKKCLVCSNQKTKYVNYSRFHGVCENESLVGQFTTCVHCKSIVPILKIEPIDSSSNTADSINSQKFIEMSDFTIPSPKTRSVIKFVINKELVSATGQRNLNLPLNVDNGSLIQNCSKQEKLLEFNEIDKLVIQSEALSYLYTESNFEEILENEIKEDDRSEIQESCVCLEISLENEINTRVEKKEKQKEEKEYEEYEEKEEKEENEIKKRVEKEEEKKEEKEKEEQVIEEMVKGEKEKGQEEEEEKKENSNRKPDPRSMLKNQHHDPYSVEAKGDRLIEKEKPVGPNSDVRLICLIAIIVLILFMAFKHIIYS